MSNFSVVPGGLGEEIEKLQTQYIHDESNTDDIQSMRLKSGQSVRSFVLDSNILMFDIIF